MPGRALRAWSGLVHLFAPAAGSRDE